MTNSSEERQLEILRTQDKWRQWLSLDDERLCVQCAQSFSGHDVVIKDENSERPLLHCATRGCDSTPRDWFYHGRRNEHVSANITPLG